MNFTTNILSQELKKKLGEKQKYENAFAILNLLRQKILGKCISFCC